MISNQIGIAGGRVFDLESLISKLERSYAPKLKRCGCPMPDQCSHDLVVDYFMKQDRRNNGRCELSGGKVLINFPGAKNQEAVLRTFLNYELLGKASRCKSCPFANSCSIREEFEESDKEPRIKSEILISPANPEDMLRQKETIDLLLNDITSTKRRAAFGEHVINGVSHQEIAKRFRTSPSTIRKWFSRERRRLKGKFASLFEQDSVTPSICALPTESLAPNALETSQFPTASERSKVRRKTRT